MCDGSAGRAGELVCPVYLGGFWAGVRVTAAAFAGDRKVICIPEGGVSPDQMVLIVTKWLKDHPTRLSEEAAVLNLAIMLESYGCAGIQK
jgi:hypothetical protein